jgi:type VI protein secretion system component VasK
MQRKILLTLTAASTLALAALLGGALWSTASFVKSNATANATAQVRTTEAPVPVVPHEIMRKQGKDIRVEYFAHPF